MEREPDGTLITLMDEDGNEKEFEHIATMDHNGSSYVALIPAFQEPEEFVEGDGQLVILKMVTDENGEDILSSIDDDEEFDTIASEFEKLLENEYEIEDQDLENDEDEDDNEQ